jgi:hypothetical protein
MAHQCNRLIAKQVIIDNELSKWARTVMNINRVLKSARLLRALTGLNRKAFDELLVPFAAAINEAKYSSNKSRKRSPGGGRKAQLLHLEDKLLGATRFCEVGRKRCDR